LYGLTNDIRQENDCSVTCRLTSHFLKWDFSLNSEGERVNEMRNKKREVDLETVLETTVEWKMSVAFSTIIIIITRRNLTN